MTELRKLDVSLTKHGAHKVAALLKKYEKDKVLDHLAGSEPGINIESAQARKTLAANARGVIPEVWAKAKLRGNEAIDGLVLIAVIFSHHQLIATMQRSINKAPFVGRIVRSKDIDDKAFTNFAHVVEKLGFSTEHSPDHVDFDVHKLFGVPGLNELAKELLMIKLKEAGWDAKNSIVDECVALKFHEVFSVDQQEFRDWLVSGGTPGSQDNLRSEDADFFIKATDRPSRGKFAFKAGHNPKKTGTVAVGASPKTTTADLLHNEMQNSLFETLCQKYGKENVGSEQSTGSGTSIDIAVKAGKSAWFYEIKTDVSVKACIRQAIPQLLEYAYWQGDASTADRLIIVGPSSVTQEAEAYLAFLRKQFGLEIYYEQYKLPKNSQKGRSLS